MQLGYDEIAIEDFYDLFMQETKKLKDVDPQRSTEHLIGVLCNKDEANYIIMYARFMTACFLKQNSILYEDFVGGDIAGFCLQEVEQVDVECDHI